MTRELNFNSAATLIGSMPHTDPAVAWAVVTKYLKEWPAWPQLPMRSNLENMYIQCSQGFPGIRIDGQRILFERHTDTDRLIEQVISDGLEAKFEDYSISKDYAACLHYCLKQTSIPGTGLKGQLTGPVSWGLCVTDKDGRGIIYDEILAEAVASFLRLKASWQEAELRKRAKNTIIFLDEPYLTSLGSAFITLTSAQVVSLLSEVLAGISGLKGVHCCGSTDWPLLLGLPMDIISFDAYNYLDSFLCYPAAIDTFLERGGAIAWGIVPNDEEVLKKESLAQLNDRFCEAVNALTRPQFNFRDLVRRSLITPACGLASLSPESAEYVCILLKELSTKIRHKYSS